MDSSFICAYCFETNSHYVDPAGGALQRYVEDCQVCCQPNVLYAHWNERDESYDITSEPES